MASAGGLAVTGLFAPQSTAHADEGATLIGASDIALCGENNIHDTETAELIKNNKGNGTVFTAGDNSQSYGEDRAQYDNCFQPSWGQFKSDIRPAPGNHDYFTKSYRDGTGAGYYEYFKDNLNAVGAPEKKGYYAYNLGSWRVIVLNSNCQISGINCDTDTAGSEYRFLKDELKNNPKQCTVAYWHHPVYSSVATTGTGAGHPGGEQKPFAELFKLLYNSGVDVVMSGHNHVYERTGPIRYDDGYGYGWDPDGKGPITFTVGTGGVDRLNAFRDEHDIDKNVSMRHIANTYGVTKFTLKDGGFDYQFIPVSAGGQTDQGSEQCH
jgi:hypothetical protein